MTLNQYRIQLVEKLTQLGDGHATRLLMEASKTLRNNRISSRDQTVFWQALNGDLENVRRRAQTIQEKQATATLNQIIAAAQAAIAQQQATVNSK